MGCRAPGSACAAACLASGRLSRHDERFVKGLLDLKNRRGVSAGHTVYRLFHESGALLGLTPTPVALS